MPLLQASAPLTCSQIVVLHFWHCFTTAQQSDTCYITQVEIKNVTLDNSNVEQFFCHICPCFQPLLTDAYLYCFCSRLLHALVFFHKTRIPILVKLQLSLCELCSLCVLQSWSPKPLNFGGNSTPLWEQDLLFCLESDGVDGLMEAFDFFE